MQRVRQAAWILVGSALISAESTRPARANDLRRERTADWRLELATGWQLQSSARVSAPGEVLSQPGTETAGWHSARVPTTVVAALVADGTYPDPYLGTNLRRIPGTSYPIGQNFSNLPMPADSPFAVPWWYRTEFQLPAEAASRRLWLRFGGVNFRFDAWLNGTRIADSAKTAGAFRIHELDVTGITGPGANALAVLVFAPLPNDLALTFVDWNPMPPDKVMGIYRPVTIRASGPVALRHPQVVTKLEPGRDRARLTVKVFARNGSAETVNGTLRGATGGIAFEQAVTLAAGETRELAFAPGEFPQLVVEQPKLWWPAQYGDPVLHRLDLEFAIGDSLSDHTRTQFGIREFTSEMTPAGHLLFRVNGKPILIRGAGWTSEMMLRYTRERDQAEIRLVKDMGLNTIRLEGKLEDDHFFDITDREGILVMPGWCCCDHWEKWKEWQDKDLSVATASLRDQILRLRGRASVFVWLNGSDNPPAANVEKAYLDVLRELGFPNPVVSSATEKEAPLSGKTGVKMRGPYEWVPPIYWYTDTRLGGPHGFATEIGPGPAPPPLESLKRFLPEDVLWPINDTWDYHCGGGPFKDLEFFTAAMDARYGPSQSAEEYSRKAQVAAYESHRAMFESFSAHKYTSTGVIQWMLNNAWPGMIWHLYDFCLRPGGSYFGTKKACEPLHVQYSYDDRSVLVVNSTLAAQAGLTVTARVVDLGGGERLSRQAKLDVAPDGVAEAFELPPVDDLSPTYFLLLTLDDALGRTVSRNAYWLSTRPETMAWEKSKWYVTPVASYADLTGLQRLAPAQVRASAHFETSGTEGRAMVRIENNSKAIAFFLRASLRRGPEGEEALPVSWNDNYLTLLPGEGRELVAHYATRDLGGAEPAVTVEGWNVARSTAGPRGDLVSVWVTAKATGDRLASRQPLVFQPLPQPVENLPTVIVDPSKAFQTIEGIGGALTDAAAETFAKLPPESQEQLLEAYFDPERGIGYTLGRTHINSCDFSSESYAYADEPGDVALSSFTIEHDRRHRLPFIKAALARAGTPFKIFASPWSAPAWMKTNGDMLHGGKLEPEYRDAWARYFVRFVEEYEKEGVPIWGLTVQNEPMATQIWESLLFTGGEERDFVRDHLGPALEKAGLSRLRLMIWDHNRGIVYQRAKAVYDDPRAARYVWGTGFHWYVGDHFENVRAVHDAWPDKQLLFTEGTPANYDPANPAKALDWKWGETYGRSLVNDLNNWAVGWTDWNVLLDEQGGPNHVGNYCLAPVHGDTATGALTFTPSYYYIGHFSKFVRPGARRVISTSNDDALLTTAFVHPNGSVVTIVMNEGDEDLDLGVWVDGRIARTRSPAHSIVTLRW